MQVTLGVALGRLEHESAAGLELDLRVPLLQQPEDRVPAAAVQDLDLAETLGPLADLVAPYQDLATAIAVEIDRSRRLS